MLALLSVLPLLTYPLVGYAVHPARPVFAPVRLALTRAALIIAGTAVVTVELLSAAHALTFGPLTGVWCLGLALAAVAATWRYRRERGAGTSPGGTGSTAAARLRNLWHDAAIADRVLAVALIGLILAELVLALAYAPNNYDSQTYHLPKIEHWVAQHDVQFYPTYIHRQLSIAPGAEYLLLHLRLLTGGDLFYNLLQWSAGAACALVGSRIAGQLGGGRRAQLLTAFVVGTTPIVALEATSTQTDLVVAGWVACVATLVLDQLRRRTGAADALLIGAAVGLTNLTKATGLLAAGPLLVIWLVAQVRLARPMLRLRLAATALAGLAIVAVALAISGPYLNRVDDAYGNPLGPPYLRQSISMQRHDPAAILVNALRIGQTVLQAPSHKFFTTTGSAVVHVARALHVNPNDPRITFPDSTFPAVSWLPDEDHASFPVEALLVLIGAAILTVRPSRAGPGQRVPVRAYAGAFWLAVLLYVATVKWQPWGNRLILFVFVLGAPLAGLWLEGVFERVALRHTAGARTAAARAGGAADPPTGATADSPASAAAQPAGPAAQPARAARMAAWRRWAAVGLAAVALATSGCAGWAAVMYGWPRRMVGSGSPFAESRIRSQFNRRPEWLPSYERSAAAIRASGAHRVGLVQTSNSWEYPWWVLLRGDTIVALQSLVPSLPPPRPDSLDAIVCRDVSIEVCRKYVPRGWTLHTEPYNTWYALPPGRDPAGQPGG